MACFVTSSSLPPATQGQSYTAQIAPNIPGKAYSTTISLVSGALPDGLTIGKAGIISGTPSVCGDFSFTLGLDYTMTKSGPVIHCDEAFSLTVVCVNAPTVPDLTVLSPPSNIFPCPLCTPCINPDAPYENLTSEAPDSPVFVGLNFGNPQDTPPLGGGTLSGGLWSSWHCGVAFTSNSSQADANQQAANAEFACSRSGGACVPPCPPSGPGANVFYSTPQLGVAACPDGSVTNFISPQNYANGPSEMQADRIAASYAATAARQERICLSDIVTQCCAGQSYSSAVNATCLLNAVAFALVGSLPPGLTLNQTGPRRLAISGTPTTPGDYPFIIQASTSNNVAQKTYTVHVLGIVEDALPDGSDGTAYSQSLTGLGGTAPYTFSLISGSLPHNLSLDPSGTISGTPDTVEVQAFTVGITDAKGNACTKDFTLNIAPGGLNWGATNWDTVLNIPGSGSATGSASGNTLNAAVSSPGGGGGSDSLVGIHASLAYVGPSVNCYVKITLTNFVVPGAAYVFLEIYQDGIPFFNAILAGWSSGNPLSEPGSTNPSPGVYIVPFTVNATVGSLIEITGMNIGDSTTASAMPTASIGGPPNSVTVKVELFTI